MFSLSTLAALISRILIFPNGALEETSYFARLIVIILSILIFYLTKKKLSLSNGIFCYHAGYNKQLYWMKKIFLIILFSLIPLNVNAGCDDPITDGVDYTNCRFSDGQDLAGSYLPNSNLSFSSFIQVNFDKSIMMNSVLAFGTFSESSFVRANLYESNLQGANFEQTDFSSSNLTRVNFQGATLIGANFKNANLIEANFESANILNSNFEGANLNRSTWTNGKICAEESIGKCN